jgi:hypothetical protein
LQILLLCKEPGGHNKGFEGNDTIFRKISAGQFKSSSGDACEQLSWSFGTIGLDELSYSLLCETRVAFT